MKILPVCLALLAAGAITTLGRAAEPTITTPSPVIYLADNLDEKDGLGWCLDTLGRGFAERLQAHTCKPRGGDVQFSYNRKTGQIMSVEFTNYCVANRPNTQSAFGLETCNLEAAEQRFFYDVASREFRPDKNSDQCVVVGSESRSAGPFMSRKLLLADCLKTAEALKKWIIRD